MIVFIIYWLALWVFKCAVIGDIIFNEKNITNIRVVAKGPNSQKNKGKLGIFGPPRPNKNMPTPCPYILMQRTEVVSIKLEFVGMVLAYSCLALQAQNIPSLVLFFGQFDALATTLKPYFL